MINKRCFVYVYIYNIYKIYIYIFKNLSMSLNSTFKNCRSKTIPSIHIFGILSIIFLTIIIKISLIFYFNDIVLCSKIIIEQNFLWRATLYPIIMLNEFTIVSFISLRHEIRVWVIPENKSIFPLKNITYSFLLSMSPLGLFGLLS